MVEVLTDNRNRTVSELRYVLSKNGESGRERMCSLDVHKTPATSGCRQRIWTKRRQ